jgi:TonB family protein
MSRTRIAVSLAVVLALLSLTGKLATSAFPLESPRTEGQQLTLLGQAPDTSATSIPTASSLAIPTEELSQKLLNKVIPRYPAEAKIQRVQGEVLLAVNVNTKGEVQDVQIKKGHPLLVRAAVDSVRQWKYAPYVKDGVAVPVSSTVFVNFALSGSAGAGDPPPGPTTVRLGTNAMAANLVSRVEPIYPLEAKQKGVEGEVVFEVTVDEQGEVIDVQVLGGNAILVAAAYDAVRQWRYTPVLLNGNPVRAKANVSIKFELIPKNAAARQTPTVDGPAAVINAPQAEWLRQRLSEKELERRINYANERFRQAHSQARRPIAGASMSNWVRPTRSKHIRAVDQARKILSNSGNTVA